jgi:hypothetical protein
MKKSEIKNIVGLSFYSEFFLASRIFKKSIDLSGRVYWGQEKLIEDNKDTKNLVTLFL